MPELPEVETIARALKPDLVGRTILSADLRWARTLATSITRSIQETDHRAGDPGCLAPRKIYCHSCERLQSPYTFADER